MVFLDNVIVVNKLIIICVGVLSMVKYKEWINELIVCLLLNICVKFLKFIKFFDVKKIFKFVKLIVNVFKSGMIVNNNKIKKDGVKNKYVVCLGWF